MSVLYGPCNQGMPWGMWVSMRHAHVACGATANAQLNAPCRLPSSVFTALATQLPGWHCVRVQFQVY